MTERFRSSVAVGVTVVGLLTTLLVGGQAGAQTPPATTSTTVNLLEDLVNKLLPTTTVPPAPSTTAAPTPAGGSSKPGSGAPAPTTTTTAPAAAVIPQEYIPLINSVNRTGARSTKPLLDALRPMQDLGLTAQEAALAGFGHFPVAGMADYHDDWWEARFGPPFHLHQGTDIFGARGTPVRAPYAGVVRYEEGGLGGKGAYVTQPDGTFYYMAHLDSFAKNLSNGKAVKQGDVVAYLGDSGNALGGSPHVHFEIHPRGGAAVNPKPILDGWLNEAINNAGALLAVNSVGVSRAVTGAGVLRRFDGQSPTTGGRAVGPLLWASSVSAGGGTIRLAQLQLTRLAGRIDWNSRTTAAQAEADALREGRQVALTILTPLTPRALAPLLGGGS
ncbi:MAG TPA: M23 family metallopeptidase [Acidimicrobiales bacterium]|nr:M23 family metallopeptidase [Acidimicrobiales bacterium]